MRFAAIAGLIRLGWLLFFRTPGSGELSAAARSAATAAGCGDLEQPVVPNPSRVHLAPVSRSTTRIGRQLAGPHDASPTAAGPHVYRIRSATRAVHNLEHANVIIYYRPAAEERAGPGDDRSPCGDRPRQGRVIGPLPRAPGRPGVRAPRLEHALDVPATISADQAVTVTTSFIDAFRGTSVAPEAPRGLLGPLFQIAAAQAR